MTERVWYPPPTAGWLIFGNGSPPTNPAELEEIVLNEGYELEEAWAVACIAARTEIFSINPFVVIETGNRSFQPDEFIVEVIVPHDDHDLREIYKRYN